MTHTKGRVGVCWSHNQQMFHIEEEPDGLAVNLRSYMRSRAVDYITLAVVGDHKEAHALIDSLQQAKGGRV